MGALLGLGLSGTERLWWSLPVMTACGKEKTKRKGFGLLMCSFNKSAGDMGFETCLLSGNMLQHVHITLCYQYAFNSCKEIGGKWEQCHFFAFVNG